MRLVPLASGSQGNATLVDFGATRLLVDAGLSARELASRLRAVDVAPDSIDWIVLSHEHQDHSRGVERFSRKHGVPVICSPATLEALDLSPIHLAAYVALPDDAPLDLDAVRVEAFPVPHDAVRPVGFVIAFGELRVGIATDLGHATTLVLERLRGCDALLVESNHDPILLRDGPYPWQLKQRVAGRMGHLSNAEAAALLKHIVQPGCRGVVLAHLSEQNNTPELARRTALRALASAGRDEVPLHVATAREPGPPVLL